jgi:hypothetical protein
MGPALTSAASTGSGLPGAALAGDGFAGAAVPSAPLTDPVLTGSALTGDAVTGTSMLALKEWAAVVHALLDGRQTVLLRKGGIHEKRFALQGSRFVVFPTVAHSHVESTRPEYASLLPLGLVDVGDGQLVVRVDLEVVEAISVRRPDRIAELEPFHIWTTESVRSNRIDFRPRRELAAIVVRARPLAEPVTVPVLPEYAGCRSWVDLEQVLFAGTERLDPVHDGKSLSDIADRVRAAVG